MFTNNLCFAVENTKLLLEKNGKEYTKCQHFFENEKQNCQESWSMKCYNYLISLNQKAQDCYVNVAKNIFAEFYGQSEEKTSEKMAEYIKFMYEQYLFIYRDTNFCKKNNCGISPYLYSEYATTHAVEDYVFKALKSVETR